MKLLNYTNKELQAKLESYFSSDGTFADVFNYAKTRFDDASHLTAHNWAHIYRDLLNAIVIGEAENANMKIVLPAAVVHDIGFLYGASSKEHGAVGAEKLEQFLDEGGISYDKDTIDEISKCIRTHKGSSHREVPETLEAKVVADADLLDKFGPVGVYQNIRSMTEFNRGVEASLERIDSIHKLVLETETGRKLAEHGKEFVATFFKELEAAYEPYMPLE